MAEFLELATFHQCGKGSITEFFDNIFIKLLDYKHNEFDRDQLNTVHIFAINENKLGIQLTLVSKAEFDYGMGTYYNTLSKMRADYGYADIYPFYPMYMTSTLSGITYPCTVINAHIDKFDENNEYATQIRISAEVPDKIKSYFIEAIDNDILSKYCRIGFKMQRRDVGFTFSEDEVRSCMVDV